MLLTFFQWLGQIHCLAFMRESSWGFVVVEMVHLLALALLGGTVLVADLEALGIGLRRSRAIGVGRAIAPLFLGSLAVMVFSGVLMVSAEPMKCYYHPAFRFKMLCFTLAVVFRLTAYRRMIILPQPSIWPKVVAAISLTLWLGVGLAGRAIAFL